MTAASTSPVPTSTAATEAPAERMTAAVLHAPGDIRVEQVDVPTPGPGQVLLKVAACGVCGSDIPRMLRNGGYVMPIICGHEFSGHVVAHGPGVEPGPGTQVGDLVSVPPLIPCRVCRHCVRGDFGLCETYDYFGSRSDGAYAEYVVSPVGNLLPMPEGLDPRVRLTRLPLVRGLVDDALGLVRQLRGI